MGNTLNNKKANGLALLPFLVFIVVFMGAGLVYQSKGVDMAFYQFPSVTAMFLAVLVAFIMFKGSINEKFDTFAKGAANVDVLRFCFLLTTWTWLSKWGIAFGYRRKSST